MQSRFQRLRACVVTTAVALACAAPIANAAEQAYVLQGITESGALAGQTFGGHFSFDDGALTGVSYESVALGVFEFEFFGQTFDLASMAAPPSVSFFDGVLLGLDAVYDGGSPQFAFVSGFFGLDDAYFAYQNGVDAGFGSFAVTPVPEPDQVAMLLAGLGLVAGVARRRMNGAKGAIRLAS